MAHNSMLNMIAEKEIPHSITIKIKRKNSAKGLIISCTTDTEDGKKLLICGHSLCSKDDRYERVNAYIIALSRAGKQFDRKNYVVPASIKHEWEKMLRRINSYFKGDNIIFPAWWNNWEYSK